MSDFGQEEPNKKKLFVGNLPFTISQSELEEVFSQFGKVSSVAVITDRMSGRPKGFAFVEFETEEEAQAAVDGMAGKKIGERDAVVNLARPRSNNGGSRGGSRGGFGGGGRSFDRNDRRGGNRY